MSRIGFKPISLPSGITVTVNGNTATVKGAKGEVSVLIPSDVSVEVKDGKAQVKIINTEDARQGNENEGTVAANLKNAIHGVSVGWKKELEIAGTGYRATMKGKAVSMFLGYSHEVLISPVGAFTKISVPDETHAMVQRHDVEDGLGLAHLPGSHHRLHLLLCGDGDRSGDLGG